MFSQASKGVYCKAFVYAVRLFYQEAKMFARKDSFAQPSIAQFVQGMGGTAAKAYAVRLSALIIYIINLCVKHSSDARRRTAKPSI